MLSNWHRVAAVTRGFWEMLLSWWHCTTPPLGAAVDERPAADQASYAVLFGEKKLSEKEQVI